MKIGPSQDSVEPRVDGKSLGNYMAGKFRVKVGRSEGERMRRDN